MSRWLKPLALMSSVISLCTLTACGTTTASVAPIEIPPSTGFCLVAQPIYWSPSDTDRTIAQVKALNALGKSLCGWGTARPVTGLTP